MVLIRQPEHHLRPGKAILFDLGNTLAAYYRPAQFGPILAQCVEVVHSDLRRRGYALPGLETALAAAHGENREASDFRFSPMGARLARIFQLPEEAAASLGDALCERFLEPIFAVGRIYEDTIPVLTALREQGIATAIVSNAPWGSPPQLWRSRLAQMGLASLVTEVIMCGDIGWRKPAPQIFHHATERLGVQCGDCMFVGDEPQWDVAGSAAVGMRPVLIDRDDIHPDHPGLRIRSLRELL